MTPLQVLITGGTGRVGRALATGFAKAGWQVTITARNQQHLDAFTHELDNMSGLTNHGIAYEFDASLRVSRLVNMLRDKGVQPHCLINNVRDIGNLELGPGGCPSVASWMHEFYLSAVVAYELTMELLTDDFNMLENVINISSIYGIVAPNQKLYLNPETESPIHYGVCKAALIHLTKELAVRLAPNQIRVNAISYGGIEGRVASDFLERYSWLCPQERMLTTEDVAGPALFLASPSAKGTTGHNLVVDGGWSIW